MQVCELIEQVRTREDFVRFLHKLEEDSHINMDEWENKDISSYLDSVSSWVEDMDGYYENMNIEPPKDVDWRFLATLFYVGKIYE
ncbi:MAG: hypothetical protein K2H45_02560 [Acetatifactor sp.]|nr:hypothetical protein [Acetatifactor sp.]